LAMYWGDATQFAKELLDRYEEYVRGGD
jgi:hypothetical protein